MQFFRGLHMKHKKISTHVGPKPTLEELNTMLERIRQLDCVALDRQINKDTGIWKRAQEMIGIPRSPETKQKISYALKGHGVSAITREKISTSLRKFHEYRNQERGEGGVTPPKSTLGVSNTTRSRSTQAPSALLQPLQPNVAPVKHIKRRNP